MATNTPKHILIAPLDWGLGHTTRCVPVISAIQRMGHVPVVAGNESQLSFLRQTFRDIATVPLRGYNITYSHWNRWAQAGLLLQVPGILNTIKNEHQWLRQLCSERQIDGIIADNRYGLHHPTIPAVIMTHQLQLQTGMGKAADKMVQRMHYRYLERFSEVWVPDVPGAVNLGGALSHSNVLPEHTQYMGLLSRFAGMQGVENDSDKLVVLLSGPEPQRSNVAAIIWQQIRDYKGPVAFIEGSDHAATPAVIPPNVAWHKRVAGEELAPLLAAAGMVVCRSGYSTLMDLAAMNKKAIMIPTPGQTEQEYLARHLHKAGIFYHAQQSGFDLQKAVRDASSFPFRGAGLEGAYGLYEGVVREWVNGL